MKYREKMRDKTNLVRGSALKLESTELKSFGIHKIYRNTYTYTYYYSGI